MILLVMGVTGSGKSTIGRMLAERLGWVGLEADDFHSAANKEKKSSGVPLSDADRIPWLEALHTELRRLAAAGKSAVLACSALKNDYRRRLASGLDVKLVYLQGSRELIADRLRCRMTHFAGEEILDAQFGVLGEPQDALVVDITDEPQKIVDTILQKTIGTP